MDFSVYYSDLSYFDDLLNENKDKNIPNNNPDNPDNEDIMNNYQDNSNEDITNQDIPFYHKKSNKFDKEKCNDKIKGRLIFTYKQN